MFAVFGKPYSIDERVWKRMEHNGHQLVRLSYQSEDVAQVENVLGAAVEESQHDGKRIILIDVGGYFSEPLARLRSCLADQIAGVVEDTTFGHKKYLHLATQIPVPVLSVARSALKEIEAKFVGNAAVTAMEGVFRDLGVSLPGRDGLVIGYGMIGTSVAEALRAHGMRVSVYDRSDARNLQAYCNGFTIHKKLELLKHADIVFSATGENAVKLSDIEFCKSGVVLASAGSQDIEFDMRGLGDLSVSRRKIGNYITEYVLPNQKRVIVVYEGAAVNFIIGSVPTEVIDLVFAELLTCSVGLLEGAGRYCLGRVHQTPQASLDYIAKEWLKFVNY